MQSAGSNRGRLRLVIADDHDLVREGIRSRLSDEDFVDIVGEARNGLEAVELATALKPDMALLDISMPQLNGLEAAQQIKLASPSTKILFLSIYDNEEYVREALRIGANGFVLKDVSKAEMINAIKSVAQGATYLGPQAAASLASKAAGRPPRRKRLRPDRARKGSACGFVERPQQPGNRHAVGHKCAHGRKPSLVDP